MILLFCMRCSARLGCPRIFWERRYLRRPLAIPGARPSRRSAAIGKTLLARAAARRRGADWHFAEFRDHSPLEAQARLRTVRCEVLGSAAAILILDDFEALEHSEAGNELAALRAAIRRRDGAIFLICARPPPPSALARLGCDGDVVTSVPYLDVEEVTDLIAQSQGNARWAPLIHAAMSDGHPQMTHAALDHLRTSGWSRTALREVVGGEHLCRTARW